jgi:D-alanyl-lipoteichoic acid acyltransferase DltB (MBOAT superfamily)
MLFNSLDFAAFLPLVFLLYWFVVQKNLRLQNAFVLGASYFFYGWWDWRFLLLILFSTVVDFHVGKAIGHTKDIKRRKLLLWTSIIVNIGLLGFFKYYNFFLDNFIAAYSFFGKAPNIQTLQIILPVGISFYTFQTLSYTIDIYRKKIAPTHDFISFAAFVSFFPQLVAGPIERASNLLPQFFRKRRFEYDKAVDGLRQILWGLFKKVVIADSCGEYADLFFNHSDQYPGSALLLGALFFAFQIYGDFSGYSDIAIGTARLLGFDLMQNFAYPYFSRDIAEFWRCWHISLSTWFRDYVYIPLGGSRGGVLQKIRNVFIIFLVSGFWHGANWTFIAWGALHSLYFLPLLLLNKNRKHLNIIAPGRILPDLRAFGGIALTFSLSTLAWVFFRAENIGHALQILREIGSASILQFPDFEGKGKAFLTVLLIFMMLAIEWQGRTSAYGIEHTACNWPRLLRWTFYGMLIFAIGMFMQTTETPFIYFQF